MTMRQRLAWRLRAIAARLDPSACALGPAVHVHFNGCFATNDRDELARRLTPIVEAALAEHGVRP